MLFNSILKSPHTFLHLQGCFISPATIWDCVKRL